MSEERTITVRGYFDDKQVTKPEFIKTWVEHISECRILSILPDWQRKVDDMVESISAEAADEFDRTYSTQQELKKNHA